MNKKCIDMTESGTNFPPHTYSSIYTEDLETEGDGIVSADSFKTSNTSYKCECLKSSGGRSNCGLTVHAALSKLSNSTLKSLKFYCSWLILTFCTSWQTFIGKMDWTIFIILLSSYIIATVQLNCPSYNPAESRTFKSFDELKRNKITFDKTTEDYKGISLKFSIKNISKVPSNTFMTSTSKFITGLDLRNKAIMTLEDKAFASLYCLSVLDLSMNKLAEIRANVFENLTHLRSLNISGNNLSNVDSGAFSSLALLKLLDLSFNNLSKLIFPRIKETFMIEIFNVSHNKFKKINDISLYELFQLKELKLNNNEIAMFFFGVLKQSTELEKLDVSSNQMVYMDFREINVDFKHLKVLNLSHNYLQLYKIACGIVTNFTSKTLVDLNLKELNCDEWKVYIDIFRTYHVKLAPGANFFAEKHINGYECQIVLNSSYQNISKEAQEARECIENEQKKGGLFEYVGLVAVMIILSFLILFAVDHFGGWGFMRKLIGTIRGIRANEDTVSLSYAQLTPNGDQFS